MRAVAGSRPLRPPMWGNQSLRLITRSVSARQLGWAWATWGGGARRPPDRSTDRRRRTRAAAAPARAQGDSQARSIPARLRRTTRISGRPRPPRTAASPAIPGVRAAPRSSRGASMLANVASSARVESRSATAARSRPAPRPTNATSDPRCAAHRADLLTCRATRDCQRPSRNARGEARAGLSLSRIRRDRVGGRAASYARSSRRAPTDQVGRRLAAVRRQAQSTRRAGLHGGGAARAPEFISLTSEAI